MNTGQRRWTAADGWMVNRPSRSDSHAQLVLVFGARERLKNPTRLAELREIYPAAHLVGCSTSGEIADAQIFDDSIVATSLAFDDTIVRVATSPIEGDADSDEAGRRLARQLPPEGLSHLFVLSDGLRVNGSKLVDGLISGMPDAVTITGGLAGDGTRFEETLLVCNGETGSHMAAAVGFYGSSLRVGCASLGGWDPFGPERFVTKASGNVLYELDGQSALALYKRYLGEHAQELPAAGLLFPLSVRRDGDDEPSVRTILGIDETVQSMTFAGDIPVGARARLMKANFDRLIDGATGAAKTNFESIGAVSPDVALLISCVGRRLVLKQRTEEEVEAVRDVLGSDVLLAGFYSYGEICPFRPSTRCQLHNQTMTVTTLSERSRA